MPVKFFRKNLRFSPAPQETDPYFFLRMVKDCKPKQETCYQYDSWLTESRSLQLPANLPAWDYLYIWTSKLGILVDGDR